MGEREGAGFKLPYDRAAARPPQPSSPLQPLTEDEYRSKVLELLNRIASGVAPEERSLFYEISSTIATAQTTVLREDDSGYNRERVFDRLGHNAKELNVYNDGPGPWYIRGSHDGQNFTEEFPLYEGEAKTYFNVYELRHRAPVVGMGYRITEFPLWKQKNVDYKAGREYIRNQTLAVGNAAPATAYTTSDEHNINAALNRNATTGYVKNLDISATLFIWISIDGTEYGQSGAGLGVEYATIQPLSALNIDGGDVFSIRVGADANNIDYEVFLA